MSFAWPVFDVETACALGIGGTFMGLFGLLFGPLVRGRYAQLATVACVAGWLIGLPLALALHVEPFWWLPPLALLSVAQGFAILRRPWLERFTLATVRLLRRGRVQAVFLLLVSPLALALYADRLFEATTFKDNDLVQAVDGTAPLEDQPSHWAQTDTGRSVPLYVLAQPEPNTPYRSADDATYLQNHRLQFRVILEKTKSDDYNCHGWVFTGGRYWVRGGSVDMILQDNGYRVMSSPQIGDLAIYREANGQVAHSGVVCGFTRDQEVLVESKWGRLGRFIHRSDQHGYPDTTCTYYSSLRTGHLLRILDESPAHATKQPEK